MTSLQVCKLVELVTSRKSSLVVFFIWIEREKKIRSSKLLYKKKHVLGAEGILARSITAECLLS